MRKLDALIIYYNSHPKHYTNYVYSHRFFYGGIRSYRYTMQSWDAIRLEKLVNNGEYNVKIQVAEYWTKIIITRKES